MAPNLETGLTKSNTATHATAAVATITGTSGKQFFITDISASSDKAGSIILVKDGTTVIWQDIVGASFYSRSFAKGLRVPTSGADCSVSIDGTALCKANIAGVMTG